MYTLILTILLRGGVFINTTHGWSQHDCQVASQMWLSANKGNDIATTAICVPGGPDGETRLTR